MKKIMVKNLLILSLAFGALVLIGNNVFANDADPTEKDIFNGFDNGKKLMTTRAGNYCCCTSVQAYCNSAVPNCTSAFCGNNP